MSTALSLRYSRAVTAPRPKGARLLIGFSPKLQRRVTLYSRRAFEQWLLLESDPSVIEFCERPLILKTPAGAKLADFWVHRGASEEFLVIDDNITPIDPIEVGGDTLALRVIQPAALAASRQWTQNWEHLLPVINSSVGSVRSELAEDVLRFLNAAKPLMQIERNFAIGDPSVVRACVFELLRVGRIAAPSLRTEALTLTTSFMRATQ